MKGTEKLLKEELSRHFKGHGQRLTMMSKFVLAVLQMCTVNFAQLALALNTAVKVESNFKRLQRFVKEYRFCQRSYVQFAWALFGTQGQWIALSMDRTNWKFGHTNINILIIGISWRGTAIPLVWTLLDKQGQSNQRERIELFEQLLSCLTDDQRARIRYLLMDREFGAHEWISWLKSRSVHFVIRIRKDARVRKPDSKKEQSAWKLFRCEEFRVLRKMRIVFGHRVFIAGQQVSSKEYLILISDLPLSHGRQIYGERWGIEVFFSALKRRGFNFERTHLTNLERIATLIFILAIAFVWTLKTGEFLVENGYRIPIKRLKNRKAKLKSIFRIGLDHLRHALLNFLSLYEEIRLLSCT